MIFSSLPPYRLDRAPNWQHPAGVVCGNNDSNSDMRPPQGSIRPNSVADRSRLTKLPQQETGHKCPRCASSNTKFCYYNNYSLSQPRHFCKTCRRYWTRGGSLRTVPVGGGIRRNNKKSKISRSKSPVTNICSTSGISSTSCTTDNIIAYNFVTPSILPQFPSLPSVNHVTEFGAEDNIGSCFGEIQTPPAATSDRYSDQWRMQEFPSFDGLELLTSNEYGIKAVDCGPSQIGLVKFKENHESMRLSKNLLGFPGNDHHQYWTNGNAWNNPNGSRSSTDHFF